MLKLICYYLTRVHETLFVRYAISCITRVWVGPSFVAEIAKLDQVNPICNIYTVVLFFFFFLLVHKYLL